MAGQSPSVDTLAQRESAMDALRIHIETAIPAHWLYPSGSPVKGFDGVGPFMMVGYRPSTNGWGANDAGRRRLYGGIGALGMGPDSHITDCLKSRSKVGEDMIVDPSELALSIDILRAEIAIARPPFLIVLGDKALHFLTKHKCNGDLGLFNIGHYANRFAKDEFGRDPFQSRLAINVEMAKDTPEWKHWEAVKVGNPPQV